MTRPSGRQWPEFEVRISMVAHRDDSGGERRCVGDIDGRRRKDSVRGIGLKENHRFLWLALNGLTEMQFQALKQRVVYPPPPSLMPYDPNDSGLTIYDRRRYCIPIHRLKQVAPWLDLNRCYDLNDSYQPFIAIDSEDYTYLAAHRSLSARGLVFDKITQRYI